MRRNFKFLMQAFVCLLVIKLWFVPVSQASNAGETLANATDDRRAAASSLSPPQIQVELSEAKRLLQAKTPDSATSVGLAAYDRATSQIHLVSLDKDSFLTKGGDFLLRSQQGSNLRVRIVRPNGVNTAVRVTDAATGASLFPLTVKFPIEKDGRTETAFYTSAHPTLISPELEEAGRSYVTTTLNRAAQSLATSGVTIPSDIIEVAAHLVVVEHTDHKRFLSEDRADISREVLSLYALNQGDTYRFSVSSAGAGGMIQMIPKTYQAIREHHPNVTLKADFVEGMTDHENALKAMLLYIIDTWKFLQSQDEVQQALGSGVATKTELLAAGYNSNPYKLPSYLSSAGNGWRSAIPAETQMYLAIYQSVDANVDFAMPSSTAPTLEVSASSRSLVPSAARRTAVNLVSWIGEELLTKTAALSHVIP